MEFEILVRKRGENVYAAYCPQLDLVVTGSAHAEVEDKMRRIIEQRKKPNAGIRGTADPVETEANSPEPQP